MKEGVNMPNLKNKLAIQLNSLSTLQSKTIPQEQVEIIDPPSTQVQVVPEFAVSFNDAKERIQRLQEFVKEFMKPGVDYGVIPGCAKPTLLKPGAEKLCDIYGFSKLITVTNRSEDWDQGFVSYEVKATLLNKRTGLVEAEGIGGCNSKEKKYKNQDAFSIANTILKMAKKRAIVDAVLSATRSSGIFSQDIEEYNFANSSTPIRVLPAQIDKAVSESKLTELYNLAKRNRISTELAKSLLLERYKVDDSRKLTATQADDFLNYLQTLKPLSTVKNAL